MVISKRFVIFTDRAERIENPAIRYRRAGVPCLQGNEKHIACFQDMGFAAAPVVEFRTA